MNKESLGAFEGAIIAATPAPYDPTGKIAGTVKVIDAGVVTETTVLDYDALVALTGGHSELTETAPTESNFIHHEENEPPEELIVEQAPVVEAPAVEEAPVPTRKHKSKD